MVKNKTYIIKASYRRKLKKKKIGFDQDSELIRTVS